MCLRLKPTVQCPRWDPNIPMASWRKASPKESYSTTSTSPGECCLRKQLLWRQSKSARCYKTWKDLTSVDLLCFQTEKSLKRTRAATAKRKLSPASALPVHGRRTTYTQRSTIKTAPKSIWQRTHCQVVASMKRWISLFKTLWKGSTQQSSYFWRIKSYIKEIILLRIIFVVIIKLVSVS